MIKRVKASGGMYCVTTVNDNKGKQIFTREWFSDKEEAKLYEEKVLAEKVES